MENLKWIWKNFDLESSERYFFKAAIYIFLELLVTTYTYTNHNLFCGSRVKFIYIVFQSPFCKDEKKLRCKLIMKSKSSKHFATIHLFPKNMLFTSMLSVHTALMRDFYLLRQSLVLTNHTLSIWKFCVVCLIMTVTYKCTIYSFVVVFTVYHIYNA